MSKIALVVINFGGPRNLEEVPSFLESLLTDQDVIRTPFPRFMQDAFFRRIARKRAEKTAEDYQKIGGKSPIFEDTEWIARAVAQKMDMPYATFHRYLEETHDRFREKVLEMEADEYWVFPLFPQFSYATTGSVARWFEENLPKSLCKRFKWVSSYPEHSSYVRAFVENTKEFLEKEGFKEEETALVFSAHGLPESFIRQGDPYQKECEGSFHAIRPFFPNSSSFLSYQSQFGKAKWIGPSTAEWCSRVKEWIGEKKQIVFLPLSFTSDHIETLFEVEEEYVGALKAAGFSAHRCPALGRRADWVESIVTILRERLPVENAELIRR